MRLLGIDPGLGITGYGLVEYAGGARPDGRDLRLVEAGIVRTTGSDLGVRLCKLFEAVGQIVDEFKPHAVIVEKLYSHYRNPSTAILMAHARGVICLAAARRRIRLVDVASTHAKKAVLGAGHASKDRMQRMVQQRLRLSKLPEPPDVADALGLTIAYAAMLKTQKISERGPLR